MTTLFLILLSVMIISESAAKRPAPVVRIKSIVPPCGRN